MAWVRTKLHVADDIVVFQMVTQFLADQDPFCLIEIALKESYNMKSVVTSTVGVLF
jgi:hypothetical protein